MAESFENLDDILRGWAKDKIQKRSCRGIELVREAGRRKKKPLFFTKRSRKTTRTVLVGSQATLNQAQKWY